MTTPKPAPMTPEELLALVRDLPLAWVPHVDRDMVVMREATRDEIVKQLAARDERIKELEQRHETQRNNVKVFREMHEQDYFGNKALKLEVAYLRAKMVFNECPCTQHDVLKIKAWREWQDSLVPSSPEPEKAQGCACVCHSMPAQWACPFCKCGIPEQPLG